MLKVKAFMSGLFILAIMLFTSSSVTAQNEEQTVPETQTETPQQQDQNFNQQSSEVDELANDLASSLALNEEQISEVKSILIDYQNNVRETEVGMEREGSVSGVEEAKTEANDQISELLDESQKTTFENMKEDFWSNVDSKIGANNSFDQTAPEQNQNDMQNDQTDEY